MQNPGLKIETWDAAFSTIAGSAAEEVLGLLHEHVAADIGDGVGERDLLGAGFDAVLGEAALLNAAIAGEGAETFFREDLAGGVIVEELDLGDGGGADEAVSSLNCGQTSMQQVQEMQLESG